jgi:hypothetical protein
MLVLSMKWWLCCDVKLNNLTLRCEFRVLWRSCSEPTPSVRSRRYFPFKSELTVALQLMLTPLNPIGSVKPTEPEIVRSSL